MAYKYNPLLRQDLQKVEDAPPAPEYDDELSPTSENAVQNKVITAKLSEMEADTRKKVSKFFNSIEELEVGEIGECQGETTADFVNGYFYKRQDGGEVPIVGEPITSEEILKRGRGFDDDDKGPYLYLLNGTSLTSAQVTIEGSYSLAGLKDNSNPDSRTYQVLFLPSSLSLQGYNVAVGQLTAAPLCGGVLYPYCTPQDDKTAFYELRVNSNVLECYDTTLEEWVTLDRWGAYGNIQNDNAIFSGAFYYPVNNKLAACRYFVTNWGGVIIPQNATKAEQLIWYPAQVWPLSTSGYASFVADAELYTITGWQTIPGFIRVDTQPSLDPSDFATAAQGAKADTALQSISKGTDGSYITTTVTAKDANNQQTVGASLTIQDIATADNDHRGLLEALNTRNYIDTQIYNVSLNFFFYGVQWDESDPSPDCVRIGNMSLHAELPVQNAIVGGLLQDDLTFTPFPDQSDWSAETVDGSAGQVMVQIPKHYFKSEIHGTIHKKLISQYPLAGFIEIPLMYVSAEKATVDRTDPSTPKLCSAVNMSPEYRGGNNTADWDNTYRSLLGKPATNISLTNFRQYARNRAAGTAWNCHTYLAQRVLYWLFVTEYATLNSQKAFNAAKDANGYMQGGLGPGVSIWNGSAWNAFNNYNPLIPCGYMLEFGNQSAVKNYSVKDANNDVLITFEVNSYRGIQSPFGDIWDWTDGILVNVQSEAEGGMSTCYVSDEPADFSSSDYSRYKEVGNTPRADDWIKKIHDNEMGDIICETLGSSSSSNFCDYYWGSNIPESGSSLRVVRFGGPVGDGSHCGFLCTYTAGVPSTIGPHFGTRLNAIPPAN